MNINDNFEEVKLIKGKSLANLPFKVDNINIYTPSLLKIFDIGEEEYNYYINLITLDTKKTMQNTDMSELSEEEKNLLNNFTAFDMLIINILEDEKLWNDVVKMLEFFLCKENEKVNFIKNGKTVYFYVGDINDEKIITRDNYDEIIDVIKIQNDVLDVKEEKKYNPANKKVAEFIRKMEERKAKLNKLKKRNEINILDLVSILASNSKSLNLLNIWDLNIYQFNDQLARLQINENYEIQKHLLGNPYAGESIDLENNHYFKKITPKTSKEDNKDN